jgi:hypothetical protein
MAVHGKIIISSPVDRRRTALIRYVKMSAAGGDAVAVDELWAVLFLVGESGIGLEAAAAAGFVGAHCADDD